MISAQNDMAPTSERTIACVYPTSPLSLGSQHSVARALAQLLHSLVEQGSAGRIIAACPPRGEVPGVTFTDLSLSPTQRLRRRTLNSRYLSPLIPRQWRPSQEGLHTSNAIKALKRDAKSPEVVVAATTSGPLLARRHFPQSKIIYWIHSPPSVGDESRTLAAINCADAVVVNTHALYRCLWDLYQRSMFRPPVWVINPIVDFRPQVPTTVERAMGRRALNLDDNDFVICHMGRAAIKGLQIVESALSLCQDCGRRYVILSGGGKTVTRRRVGDNAEVRELGKLSSEELTQLYQAADLGVVPSVWFEAFGLVVAEMMSAGLCVVASRNGGIAEIIAHESTGVLIDDPNDVVAWAGAIRELRATSIAANESESRRARRSRRDTRN